jgi:hypothetical protein
LLSTYNNVIKERSGQPAICNSNFSVFNCNTGRRMDYFSSLQRRHNVCQDINIGVWRNCIFSSIHWSCFPNPRPVAMQEIEIFWYVWYVIPTRCISHRVFYLILTTLHVSGVVTTYHQVHKATASTESGKHYTLLLSAV